MSATAPIPPELWSVFDAELDSLIGAMQSADAGYVSRRGMSLASTAVASAGMRLNKVICDIRNTCAWIES